MSRHPGSLISCDEADETSAPGVCRLCNYRAHCNLIGCRTNADSRLPFSRYSAAWLAGLTSPMKPSGAGSRLERPDRNVSTLSR